MAWDATWDKIANNTIAYVEGAGAWDAINYRDPITLGVMQWYGTRAAGLLTMIKKDHPGEYAKLPAGLRADHAGHADSSRWWTTRKITGEEGKLIKPVLRASKDTQAKLLGEDVKDYKAAAIRIGMNPDTNPEGVAFFMVMYHQTPARAIRIVTGVGVKSGIDRIHAAALNDPTFKGYKTRYNQAKNFIKGKNPPNIIDKFDDDDEIGDGGTGGGADGDTGYVTGPSRTGDTRIEVVGDRLAVIGAGGGVSWAEPIGQGTFILKASMSGPSIPDATPNEEDPDSSSSNPDEQPDTSGNASEVQRKLVKFMVDRTKKYSYSLVGTRLEPDKNGYTDCSGMVRYAYKSITGKEIGTYTDGQVYNKNTRIIMKGVNGQLPDLNKMMPGDLVITGRYNLAEGRIASHVEMYMGNDRTIGHGGPGMGPYEKPCLSLIKPKARWWIKRLNGL